jgi:hypothetical protein
MQFRGEVRKGSGGPLDSGVMPDYLADDSKARRTPGFIRLLQQPKYAGALLIGKFLPHSYANNPLFWLQTGFALVFILTGVFVNSGKINPADFANQIPHPNWKENCVDYDMRKMNAGRCICFATKILFVFTFCFSQETTVQHSKK